MSRSTNQERDGRAVPDGARARAAAARRGAIVRAALAAFAENGFAATRMEDVARRAGVAKGTIYLHFADKRALFEAIVGEVVGPVLDGLAGQEPAPGETLRAFLERAFVPALAGLGASPAGAVVGLLISEGERFPDLAAIYHRQVIAKGLGAIRALARAARARGEIRDEALERFPQLLVAPALVGLVWGRLFQPLQPLDAEGLIRAQLDLLFGRG